MKNALLLLSGAGLGVVAYLLLSKQNQPLGAADQTGAWGTGQRISGAGNSVKGSLEKGFGDVTGNPSTQASGIVDKVKGAAQDAIGSAAQTLSDVTRNG